jgi:hypothetical protein
MSKPMHPRGTVEQQELMQVRAFLREVYERRPPKNLPLLDDRQAILTLADIAGYIQLHPEGLRFHTRARPPASCPRGCASMDECYNCPGRWMNPALRTTLLSFMHRWYAGELRKAFFSGGWRLIELRRMQALAAPRTALTRPLTLAINPGTLRLKVT